MRPRVRFQLIVGGLLLCGAAARAEVWEDPDLAAALSSSSLVVVGRAPHEGSQGRATVRFTVERVIRGEAPPPELEVGGLHDPSATSGPVFEADERVLLLLQRGEGGALRVPTPTFGRFPIRGEKVLYAALRDTFLRLELPLDDYERYLRLALGEPADPAWQEELVKHLRAGGPGQTGPARARAYLALESLALRREGPADLPAVVARYLDPSGPFQLRISALRALAACAADPLPGLLGALERDPEPAVRTAAAQLLCGLRAPPDGLAARLGELVASAATEPVRFVGPSDPRLNVWPAPRVALVRAIGQLGPAPAREALLAALDDPSQAGEVIVAAVEALLRLRDDRALPRELARRLRGDGGTHDLAICQALGQLTGLTHGQDAAAWKAWAARGDR